MPPGREVWATSFLMHKYLDKLVREASLGHLIRRTGPIRPSGVVKIHPRGHLFAGIPKQEGKRLGTSDTFRVQTAPPQHHCPNPGGRFGTDVCSPQRTSHLLKPGLMSDSPGSLFLADVCPAPALLFGGLRPARKGRGGRKTGIRGSDSIFGHHQAISELGQLFLPSL